MGAHGLDAGGHGCGDYRVQYEERLVAPTGVGVAPGGDLFRRPRLGPVLREGSRDPSEGAGPLRGQERARRAGDRFELGGVLEHPHPLGGVVALVTVFNSYSKYNYRHKLWTQDDSANFSLGEALLLLF